MTIKDYLLVAPPDSPYKLLGADYDDDARAVQTAFRKFFKKNPRKGVKIGRNAQQKLTNAKERVKADALCCAVPAPKVGLTSLQPWLEDCETDMDMLASAVDNLTLLSDIFFPEQLSCDLPVSLDLGELEYRSMNNCGK